MEIEKVRECRVNLLACWLIDAETYNIEELQEPYKAWVVSWCAQDFLFKKVVEFYLKRQQIPQPIGFLATVKRALRRVA